MHQDKFQEVIEEVKGTCRPLSDFVDEDLLTKDNYQQLDDQIFECVQCNWWYEIDEQSEYKKEMVCQDCYDTM